jgi:hypothetical protein
MTEADERLSSDDSIHDGRHQPIRTRHGLHYCSAVTEAASYHAIYFALHDATFFEASLRSIYPHISGATVITRYDRDRWNDPTVPDNTVDLVLSRAVDPERKVNVIVTTDEAEPRMRNRAMAFAHLPRRARRIVPLMPGPPQLAQPDYFWHVDSDEIYSDDEIVRLKQFVASHRARAYLLELRTYFRTWNWRVPERDAFVAVTRPGFWFGTIRHPYPTVRSRAIRKAMDRQLLPRALGDRLLGFCRVPAEVAVCHHGSYVGSRERILTKLNNSAERAGHSDEWVDRVWEPFSGGERNFHPRIPELFPEAEYVPTVELPAAIREHQWPAGWIDRG